MTLRLARAKEDGKVIPLIGIVEMGTQPEYDFPFPIKINSDEIGGPSAGLAWTLGIINTLSGGHLTGGLTIAASGTIRPDGSVGDVGGVEQKTVAVERAGATVFFVPDYKDSVEPARGQSHVEPEGLSRLLPGPGPQGSQAAGWAPGVGGGRTTPGPRWPQRAQRLDPVAVVLSGVLVKPSRHVHAS